MIKKNYYENIYIIQYERTDKKLKFMYLPFLETCNSICKKFYKFSNYKYLYDEYNLDKLKKGDLLIFIGPLNIPNFIKLKKRGIYTILFWTESRKIESSSNEIWTPIKEIYNIIPKKENQIVKYIPFVCIKKKNFADYKKKNNNMKLIFLGSIITKTRVKQKKFLTKLKFFKNHTDIWSEKSYNYLIENTSNIFYNCNQNNILPTARISKLLNSKCIIISEYSNSIDDEIYKDCVIFCKLEETDKIFNNLIKKTPEELSFLSNKLYENFSNIFSVDNIINILCSK